MTAKSGRKSSSAKSKKTRRAQPCSSSQFDADRDLIGRKPRFDKERIALGCKNMWRAVLSQILRDLCDSSPKVQAEARLWLMSRKRDAKYDRDTTCELADVNPESFLKFARKCVRQYDTGGRKAMLKAAKYLYAGNKTVDNDSNFLNGPEGIADDSELSDGLIET